MEKIANNDLYFLTYYKALSETITYLFRANLFIIFVHAIIKDLNVTFNKNISFIYHLHIAISGFLSVCLFFRS